MTVLSAELRSALEKAIVAARDAAEEASRQALDALGVAAEKAPEHLVDDERRLRVALRAEARQLGGFEPLVEECAYEQWHRMLFARFLAENDLLIHPDHGVAVSLADCEEIARDRGHSSDPWLVASEFASAMLPGIFRQDDPALAVRLAPEGQQGLEMILAALSSEVFTSDDGLGWVYQYWQAKKKKEVNASERKIGGADIAPVTQLFTEHYMVAFLLENTLGAWWAARHPESQLIKEWEYLRFDEDGKPAAGSFLGWPETVAEVTVMDPCCGSGHFLVTAFEMLRKMRTEAEGLTAAEAGDRVLSENLFGLELDARCTQIAAFALALQAWKAGGYRELPVPNVACSGISAKGRLEDWKKLATGDERLERSLERLHALFTDAADLGSLIDPLRETDGDLLAARFDEIVALLEKALNREHASDPSVAAFGHAAAGALRAGRLLSHEYTLVTTNPPFLGSGKQSGVSKAYCERRYPDAKGDLATCFLRRCLDFATAGGTAALVTPHSWLFQGIYKSLRENLLAHTQLSLIARLGAGAFNAISGAVVNVALCVVTSVRPVRGTRSVGIDISDAPGPTAKARELQSSPLIGRPQVEFLGVPDAIVTWDSQIGATKPLSDFAESIQGVGTTDTPRFVVRFWEVPSVDRTWEPYHVRPDRDGGFSGLTSLLRWEEGSGDLARIGTAHKGLKVKGKRGFGIGVTSSLSFTHFIGTRFDCTLAALIPRDERDALALAVFLESPEFKALVRSVDQALSVTESSFLKVPFDQVHWAAVASERLPAGLPVPESDDPSQLLFAGHPGGSGTPLHVAVARLVGYRWPRQTESEFMDCPALGPDGLERFADADGILCMPAIRGERRAAECLRELLATAFGDEWSPAKEADLLSEVGYGGRSLEEWLRDGFFEQHCQLFHHRPFVWQVSDGRKDGFSVLVNYHRLDRANLEKLIYTYLGDWIRQQREAVSAGTPGAEDRLGTAEELQRKLELILEGEDPYDIFVRWKPIEEQPIGWEPDLNDGVRLNIRPFVTAGVLRKNPTINWNKDRGKDSEAAPWYPVFKGDRINHHHLTLAEKRAAREAAARRDSA